MNLTSTSLFVAASLAVLHSLNLCAADPVDLLADGMEMNSRWMVKDGVLSPSAKPGGIIWSKASFGNFEISIEYKTSPKCNSGLFFRTDPKNAVQGGFEVQIASPGLYSGKHVVGSLYDAKAAAVAAGKPDGEWNKMTLRCDGPKVHATLNGKTVLELSIDDWDTSRKNPDGSKNKFKTALKDLPKTGHIGFQYHGHPVWIRNVSLTSID
jgi:hypothetical protein